jgi:uncharacterized membrane protein
MTDRPILNRLNRLLVGGVALATVASFFVVPLDGTLPIHWGPNGQVDGFAPAPVALLLPAVMVTATLSLFFILKRKGLGKDFEAGRHVIDPSISFIAVLGLLTLAATVAIGLGHAVNMPRLLTAAVGAMLLVLGNYLPKSQPNWIAGVRLPWTLRDPDNWRQTNLWTGRLMMAGGFVALVAALLNPPVQVMIAVLLAAALVPAVAGLIISYSLARQKA